jgi:hypothetical protein
VRRLRFDIDFLLLLVITTLSFLPFLSPRIVPVHDTMYAFQAFQVFYEDFYHHQELAEWLPYGMYGIPADIVQLTCFSPATYLTGLGGCLCRCRDVLLLFKVSMWLEQVFFLLGLYLLAGRIYTSRLTRFCVCLTAVMTITWVSQIGFDWRIFYLLPLVLYLLVRFFREQQAHLLWQAGIVATASVPGTASYYAALLLFLLTVISVGLLTAYPGGLRAVVRPSRKGLLFLALFFLASGTYVWHAAHSLESLQFLAEGRNASGTVSLHDFLTYGPQEKARPLLSLFTGWPPFGDNTCYLGLLALPCLGWALLRVRSPVFGAFLWGALALVLLSCGGIVARLVYYFPAMSVYRHIGLVYGPVKVLLLLCAGFGLDDLLRKAAGGAGTWRVRLNHVVAALLGTLLAVELWLVEPARQLLAHYRTGFLTLADLGVICVCLRLALIGGAVSLTVLLLRLRLLHRRIWTCVAAASFLLAFGFDLASYRFLLHATAPKVRSSSHMQAEVFRCRPMPFRDTRSDAAPDERSRAALELYTSLPGCPVHAAYTTAYNALGLDPVHPHFRTDFLAERAACLIRTRGGRPSQWPGPDFLPEGDRWLQGTIGCGGPKLRLVRCPLWCPCDTQTLEMIRQLPVDSDDVVLQGTDSSQISSPVISPGVDSFRVLDFSPNCLHVQATVAGEAPAWLVYADGYHADWYCMVNGEPTSVIPANYAFKAVKVPPGRSDVRFVFGGGVRGLRGYLSVLLGIAFAGILLLRAIRLALPLRGTQMTCCSLPSERFAVR